MKFEPYQIIQISPGHAYADEQLGSKRKFWTHHDGELWLFKYSRQITVGQWTGEDWAEKIAAEIAHLLHIPAARVELAQYEGQPGCLCRSFLPNDEVQLEHGNEILAGIVTGYQPEKRLKQADHTLDNVIEATTKIFYDDSERELALRQLASYLVLDALISNTDRHHENWGLMVYSRPSARASDLRQVAPSFDHASSLGRELTDERRQHILAEIGIERYVMKGKGGIYLNSTDPKGANPLALAEDAYRRYGQYLSPCLQRLNETSIERLLDPLHSVPQSRLSEKGRDFATRMLRFSYAKLTGLLL